jgi:hypothetical protein
VSLHDAKGSPVLVTDGRDACAAAGIIEPVGKADGSTGRMQWTRTLEKLMKSVPVKLTKRNTFAVPVTPKIGADDLMGFTDDFREDSRVTPL